MVSPGRFGYLQPPTARSASEVRIVCTREHPETSDEAKALRQPVAREARLAVHQEVEQVDADEDVAKPSRFGVLQPPTLGSASEVREICAREHTSPHDG